MKFWNKDIIDINITLSSLICVIGELPVKHGNYFYLNNYRVLNFWKENLIAANEKFDLKDKISILKNIESNHCVIDDSKIPIEWYHNKLCFTGVLVKIEHIKELYDYFGDPDNNFEQFVDPKSYWQKRDYEYINTDSGINIIKHKNLIL